MSNQDKDDNGEVKFVDRAPFYMSGFLEAIAQFNEMYRMPEVSRTNIIDMSKRLGQFRSILGKECAEIEDVGSNPDGHTVNINLQIRVDFADLLGDIIIYCASEAKRWGIPIDRILHIIMQSNFSKMGEDGKPIYDEDMKLLKGPNYWKPEPKIAKLLAEMGDMK